MKKIFSYPFILLSLSFALTGLFLPQSAEAAAPTFNSFSAIVASTGADVTVTLPAHAANDIMLLLGWVRDQNDTVGITGASGWAQVGTGCTSACSASWSRGSTSRYWLFWKRATSGSETNPVFNKSGGNGDTYAGVITYRGANTSGDPWEVLGTDSIGTTDPAVITGITTLSDESLIVVPVGGENDNNASIITTGTDPAAYVEHYGERNTGDDGAITFSEATRATIGATGNVSVNWNSGNPVGWGGITIALKPIPVTTIGNGTNPSSVTIAPGASAADLDSFTLKTNTGTDTVTAAAIALAAGSSGGLSLVSITSDNGSVIYCSQSDPVSDAVNLSGCGIPVTTALSQFKVRVTPKSHANMPVPPGSTYSVTGTVTSFTSTNNQAGTDTNSATVTIDNASPANVTSASGTAGNQQVSFSWTNPADGDFHSTIVLRSTSAVSDFPAEGTTYIVGNTIGSATVACVVTSPTASCTDSGLTNGIFYHYKIFTRDNYANYAVGVVPAGSPYKWNPSPTTISIVPTFKYVGDAQFDMTVNGTNFINGVSTVRFNGSPRATTFISSTQLTGVITAGDLSVATSSALITVFNSAPGGGTSNAQTFQVLNLIPTTTSISPDTKVANEPQFEMTVNGTNFVDGASTVKFNGSSRATTYVSSTQLTAVILASDLTTVGDFNITVTNPAPGGGTSNAQIFHVINQAPFTTSISPDTKTVGDAQFDMTVNGTNFIASSVVKFNGSARATIFVSSTQLTATILAGDMSVATSSALITVFNSAPGGGTSNAQTFQVLNPTPTTTSISPTFKYVGDAQFDMTVNGTNFVPSSVVKFDGSSRATTYVSSTQLTATILASDLTVASSSILITVTNPAPGGGTSNAQVFQVIIPDNPAPSISSITPDSKIVGDAQFEMTVNGANFVNGVSIVKFNGSSRATTYVSSTQLTATILAGDLSVATSSALITVFNSAPGGGISNAQTFIVNNPVPTTSSISPDTKTIGDSGFTMTVSGTNFVNGATVKFGGSVRATTYVGATQLTAVILASDLTTVGDFNITVANPSPVMAESNAQVFHVIALAPFISAISPLYKTVGDLQFDMTISGSNFVPSSTARFNGSTRVTTYISANQLTVVIPSSDLSVATSSARISVINPGPAVSNEKSFTVNNPTAVTSSITPSSKTIGDPEFEMTVNGSNFLNGATVKFSGSNRATTYVSSTELTAVIPATDLLTATSSVQITVANPAPILADSNAQIFAVNPVGNPLPTVTSILPTSAVAGDPAFILTVDGTNFIASSVVRFGGDDEITTYVSPTRLTAEIPADDISVAGNYNVRVFNPLPGGGLSDPQLFTVTAVPPTVAVKFSLSSADSETVGSPVIVTIHALKSDNTIDVNFNNGVTLVSTGSVTGDGLVNLVNGIASVAIYDSIAETVTLSLSDTQGTGLDVSAVKNITFTAVPVSAPGAGPSVRPTTLEISGRAFPGATISMIEKKSGGTSISSQSVDISDKGDFKITAIGIIQGEYTYNLLVRDRLGRLSQTKTYNVNFISDSLFERNILIPPTINLAQTNVNKGGLLKISGYAYPQTKVTLNLNGISYETQSTASGTYDFSINTTLLNVGSYFARAKWTDVSTRQETDWSTSQNFQISPATAVSADIDLDKNGIIDVRDWSIFLSRFNSRIPEVIKTIDFNNDGVIGNTDRDIFLTNYAKASAR